MDHEHVKIAVSDAIRPGVEHVPARKLADGTWELIRSPLYAMQVAAGDLVRVLDSDAGTFEILRRGGNVSVQFYLGPHQADDIQATKDAARAIELNLAILGGRLDGMTAGLVAFTIPVKAGFSAIENIFEEAAGRYVDAQWQYGNIYDPVTQEPLRWWEKSVRDN